MHRVLSLTSRSLKSLDQYSRLCFREHITLFYIFEISDITAKLFIIDIAMSRDFSLLQLTIKKTFEVFYSLYIYRCLFFDYILVLR